MKRPALLFGVIAVMASGLALRAGDVASQPTKTRQYSYKDHYACTEPGATMNTLLADRVKELDKLGEYGWEVASESMTLIDHPKRDGVVIGCIHTTLKLQR